MSDMQNTNAQDASPKQISLNDMRSYLQYRNDELNKELLDKMNRNYQQAEEIKHLEMTIDNYKNNFQIVNDKISKQDNLQVEINLLNKRNSELESGLSLNKMENNKLLEVIQNKDNLISQFQNLVTVSIEKFKIFEDTQRYLKNENYSLKNKIDELNSKINTHIQKENFSLANIEELKNSITRKEKEIEKLESERDKTVEKYKNKIVETETNLKSKLKAREDELKNEYIKEVSKTNAESEKLIFENEKLKLENKNNQKQILNLENTIQEKDFEWKRTLDSKDREIEKLSKNTKDMQRELKENELSYREKFDELKAKAKNSHPDEIYKAYLSSKDKQIFELENEVRKLKHTLEFVTCELKEVEVIIDSKENMIAKLRNENSEIMKEINNKKLELIHGEDELHMRLETSENRIKLLEKEKEILFREKEEDHREILNLRSRLTNESKVSTNKSTRFNMNCEASVINERSRFEYALSNEKEDQYLGEISRLQNLIIDRDRERDEMKIKLEKRLQSYKIKNEELECRIANLIKSMSSLKTWACSMERSIAELSVNSSKSNFNQDNFFSTKKDPCDNQQKNMLENLRELIANIDSKLNTSDIYLMDR